MSSGRGVPERASYYITSDSDMSTELQIGSNIHVACPDLYCTYLIVLFNHIHNLSRHFIVQSILLFMLEEDATDLLKTLIMLPRPSKEMLHERSFTLDVSTAKLTYSWTESCNRQYKHI